MSRKATPAEVDDLARQIVSLCCCDLVLPVSDGLTMDDHADKIASAMLTAYVMVAAIRKEPQDLLDEAKKFLDLPSILRRMVRWRKQARNQARI